MYTPSSKNLTLPTTTPLSDATTLRLLRVQPATLVVLGLIYILGSEYVYIEHTHRVHYSNIWEAHIKAGSREGWTSNCICGGGLARGAILRGALTNQARNIVEDIVRIVLLFKEFHVCVEEVSVMR